MKEFITTIKTIYTDKPFVDRKGFISKYSSKNTRNIISGANRPAEKRYTSTLRN